MAPPPVDPETYLSQFVITVYVKPAVMIIDNKLAAFIKKESNNGLFMVNEAEGAHGYLQIRQVMIDDVNRICKLRNIEKQFTLEDAHDLRQSCQIWSIIQNYYNPSYDLHTAALVWNGRGSDGHGNKEYWEDLKQIYARICS